MTPSPKDSARRPKQRSDGDGSVYFDKQRQKWVGVLVLDYLDEQYTKRRLRKVSANSRQAAVVKLRELKESIARDEQPEGPNITVEQWMTYWYTKIAPRRVKPLTLAGYDAKVNQYIIPLLGHIKLAKLTQEHIEDAWDRLRAEGNPTKADAAPLSGNTIHQTHRILARALKVAVQRKKLANNPAGASAMDAPSRVEHEIQPMTEAEVEAILDAAEGLWNEARWTVALSLGLRQGEALGLRWDDVDLDAGEIHIRQTLQRIKGQGIIFGTPKSATSRRSLPLPTDDLIALRAHRKTQTERRLELGSYWTDSGLVFTMEDGCPIDPSVDARRWRALLESAGVRHYRLHDARHAAGTFMLLRGVDVRVAMSLLGHSQLSVTMRYQHAVDRAKKDAVAALDRGRRSG